MKTISGTFTLAMVLFCLTFCAGCAKVNTSNIDTKLENSGNTISWKGKAHEFKAIAIKMGEREPTGKLELSLHSVCELVESSCNLEVLNNPRKKEELLDRLQEKLRWLVQVVYIQIMSEHFRDAFKYSGFNGMKSINESVKTVEAIKCLVFIIQEVSEYK